jgi:hypothetical protein
MRICYPPTCWQNKICVWSSPKQSPPLSHPQPTSQRAPARTSTEEQGPCGPADWMFLIFLLLFGSSQKEGERLPNTTFQSKKFRSPPQPTKAQNRRSSQQRITSQRAPARTSTEEQRPCGLADWMFLIFLLLFGSSQKEGERLHPKTVQSKTDTIPQQQITSQRAPAMGPPQCPAEHYGENGLTKVNSRLADYKSALFSSAMPFGTSRTA